MNPIKTKILSNSVYVPVTVNGASIQYNLDYTYLGQTVSMIENKDSEIRRRVGLAGGKILEPEVPTAKASVEDRDPSELHYPCIIVWMPNMGTHSSTEENNTHMPVSNGKKGTEHNQ